MNRSSMWTDISSQDFPYPPRGRCTDTYQAPYWNTFTSPNATLAEKTTSSRHNRRVIRSDSVAAFDKARASVTSQQPLPFPTRLREHDFSSFINEQDFSPVTNTSRSQQLLGLKSLYRSPHRLQSVPKSPTCPLDLISTPSTPRTPCDLSPLGITPSCIDIQQLLPSSPDRFAKSNPARKIRFVRSPLNTPLYDLQLRNEVHSPTLEMKRKMGSLAIQGENRSTNRNSRKFKRNIK